MRRFQSIALCFSLIAGVPLLAPSQVSAASSPGTVTVKSPTPPSAVSGLTIRAVTAARDGGMYFAYQNATGDNYSIVKQKADTTYDLTYGTNGVVTIPGMPVSNSFRRVVVMSDVNNKWWASSTGNSSTSEIAKLAMGGPTGQPLKQRALTVTDLSSSCAAAYPTSTAANWNINVNGFYAKRNSGVWLALNCSASSPNGQVEPTNGNALVALTDNLELDSSVKAVGLNGTNGSSAQCHTAALTSDPTGPASSPEVWVIRLQHTNLSFGLCDNITGITAAEVTGYDVLRISSNGTIARTEFASGGDSLDAQYSLRLDPGGRPIIVGTSISDNTKIIVARIKTDGSLDTTAGTNGFTTISTGALPSGTVSIRAVVNGIITSAKTVYISLMLFDQSSNINQCSDTTPVTFGYRPMVVSYANGLATTFGTGGVGERASHTIPFSDNCAFRVGGVSVSNSGSPRLAYRTGTTLSIAEWAKPSDATGGSEGGTGTGGYTTDTGGAPSKGDGLGASAGRVDKKVYSTKLPKATQADSALTVLTAKQAEDLDIRTNTPKICVALTTSVLMVNPGRCTVRIIDEDTKKVIRTMTTIVKKTEVEDGTTLTTDVPIYFRQASTRLSKNALAQVAELAEAAKDAARVVVIGHSAALGEVSQYSYAISRNRANAVKAALIKAGVKTPIEIVAMSYSQPEKTAKTEKAQALNRRAEVYIFPK